MNNYPYVENNLVYFNKELIIVNEYIAMRWNGRNKQYYVNLNYVCIDWHEPFNVDIQDLPKSSHAKVCSICSICQKVRGVIFSDLMRAGHSNCKGCSKFIDRTGKHYEYCEILEFYKKDKWDNAMWKCLCFCGNIFHAVGGNLENGHTTSCGCRNIELSRKRLNNRAGNKHYQYNHDLTDEERNSFRNTGKWANKVKQRDGFMCQCCGDYDTDIVAHHLNGYKHFPDQRTDLHNGVTLCKSCHNEFHSWMGSNRKKCTHNDFTNFCIKHCPNAPFLSL